ncbi:heterokaryon incompatibility protein-domain-containing protein [Pyronema domesticum]|nr:heterokaryon incompatibility protein-domain-containing protein [Pyronema domesticum]
MGKFRNKFTGLFRCLTRRSSRRSSVNSSRSRTPEPLSRPQSSVPQSVSSSQGPPPADTPKGSVSIIPPKSIQGAMSTTDTDTARASVEPELAIEHVLCAQCQNSVTKSLILQSQKPSRGTEDFSQYISRAALEASAFGSTSTGTSAVACHLCSLILGKVQQHDNQQSVAETVPIHVALKVSRSGGVTLAIQSLEDARPRWLGELSVLSHADLEGSNASSDGNRGGKFSFPSQSSRTYQNAQLAKSLASEASFPLAREWLKQCLQKHPNCTEAARLATGRPTRLIDVGNDTGIDPRVVHMEYRNKSSELEYLTLSHCWGGATILRLLTDNIDSLAAGIPMSTLPKTFQDAIIITRNLGYRYIWIDSLCIIQDSLSDWRGCSASMGEIYGGSVCTIAALTARNSHDGGCFFDHARHPLFFRPCQITAGYWVEGNTNIATDLRTGLLPMPLHTRAWVVQERILAPRTLYYGSNGLAWECVECSATEAVPAGELSRFSPKTLFFGQWQLNNPNQYYDDWTGIQAAYTLCLLTKFEDRLVAISGVIKRLETLTGWKNSWGMWHERLLLDLLWFVESPSTRPKTKEYLAPTWSWLGVEGRIMTVLNTQEAASQWMAEIIDVGTQEDGQGYLKLRAMSRRVTVTTEGALNPGIERHAPKWEEVDWDRDEMDDVGNEICCILIVRIPDYLAHGGPAFDIGLVVSRKHAIGENWVRIGVFRQLREGNSLFPDDIVNAIDINIV